MEDVEGYGDVYVYYCGGSGGVGFGVIGGDFW